MSLFPDWEQFAISQRRSQTGCIPTGYEMILRAAAVEGVDFDTFQDDFDLDKNLKPGEQPKNDFNSVADAVRAKYHHVSFQCKSFPAGKGDDKLRFIEGLIGSQQPVLVSIALEPFGGNGWHIMPVVDATDDKLILLKVMKLDGTKEKCTLSKEEFVCIHNKYDGGKDVAYLDRQ